MGFRSWLSGAKPTDITDNGEGGAPLTVGNTYTPGDPDGFELVSDDVETRALPSLYASPWSGWPAEWQTPAWSASRIDSLVDTAWGCLDKNSSILSTMPVYKTRDGQVVDPEDWMSNPDPR